MTRSPGMGTILVALVAWIPSCSERSSDVHRTSARSSRPDSASPVGATPRSDTTPALACLPVQPSKLWLSGTLRQEVRLGPPGYGETPGRDERDTILVLLLDAPVRVCADNTPGARHSAVDSISALQLSGSIGGLSSHVDERIDVMGSLFHADFGPQFTAVLIEVERIRLRVSPGTASQPT